MTWSKGIRVAGMFKHGWANALGHGVVSISVHSWTWGEYMWHYCDSMMTDFLENEILSGFNWHLSCFHHCTHPSCNLRNDAFPSYNLGIDMDHDVHNFSLQMYLLSFCCGWVFEFSNGCNCLTTIQISNSLKVTFHSMVILCNEWRVW